MRALIDENSATHIVPQLKELQLAYLNRAALRVFSNSGREDTRDDYLQVMHDLCEVMGVTVEGLEQLAGVNVDYGFILVANHLGIGKLTKITAVEIQRQIADHIADSTWLSLVGSLPNDEPFFLRNAGLSYCVRLFSPIPASPHAVEMFYPFPFDDIQKDSGAVGVLLDRPGQHTVLTSTLNGIFENDRERCRLPYAILFPETGTSGKRSLSADPYALANFRRGYAILADAMCIPVIPMVQCITRKLHVIVRILDTRHLHKEDAPSALERTVRELRRSMQSELTSLCWRYNCAR